MTTQFAATPAYLGVPDFGVIDIDPAQTALAFQAYLNAASKITGVSLDNIDRRVTTLPADSDTVTLVDLLKAGMKLFDAVVWLHAQRPKTHPLMADPTITPDKIPSMQEVSKALFYVYFMLLTQARYPVSKNTKEKPVIPNFLRSIMGLTEPQDHYVTTICSFEAQLFDPVWIRYISFRDFGQQVMSRFGLGVAGYRLFGPFKLYDHKPDMDPALRNAFQFARTVATAKVSWDVHPLTRNPNILTSRGNLNKNLGNLILECFTAEQIADMIKVKTLFATPEKDPAHRNYKTWTAVDDITGSSFIFPDPPK